MNSFKDMNKFPYYVPVINWNGRLTKVSSKKFKTVEDATIIIEKIISGWTEFYETNNWTKGVVDEYNIIKQLMVLKYDSKDNSLGHTTVVRFWNDDKIVFSLE